MDDQVKKFRQNEKEVDNFTAFFTFQVKVSHHQIFKLLDIVHFPERNLGSKKFGFYSPSGYSQNIRTDQKKP